MDDAEYIPLLKTIIVGAIQGLTDVEENEVEKIQQKLYNYSKELYLEIWLSNGEEGESVEQTKQEGIEWFDYIYSNEEYPR